uniref:Uncharacterized protein n=1 Tax=Heliothis virescens TaxID=7102 RepID=A0A2A4K7H9_HELVI
MSDSSDSVKSANSRTSANVTQRAKPMRVSNRPSASDEIAELKKMVQQLTLKLEEHTRASCCSAERPSRVQERRRSSSRHRSRSRSSYQKYPMCWYHAKFGPQAHNCVKPCDFHKAGNATGSR